MQSLAKKANLCIASQLEMFIMCLIRSVYLLNPLPPTLLTAYQYFFSKCNFHLTVMGNPPSPSLTFKI